ncbi:hypothetical protein KC19_2G199200 [Ceratodon purpureus]|uniref:Uncharacterized protein n=1 Tax=Ceratodon purpureus TaxID=3225 RepID=A0A8T0IYT5_CERPU|nr:hypothetical protein KC19_2G199200 [Ceratodon purpureus]
MRTTLFIATPNHIKNINRGLKEDAQSLHLATSRDIKHLGCSRNQETRKKKTKLHERTYSIHHQLSVKNHNQSKTTAGSYQERSQRNRSTKKPPNCETTIISRYT